MNSLQTYESKYKDTFGFFEMKREEGHRRMKREEIATEIVLLDDEAFGTATRICPKCGSIMYSHGRCGTHSYLASCQTVRKPGFTRNVIVNVVNVRGAKRRKRLST
jgi:ribosomal protein S27AE